MDKSLWQRKHDNFVHNAGNRYLYPGFLLREGDSLVGSRDSSCCPVCGARLLSDEALFKHFKYMRYLERLYGKGPEEEDPMKRVKLPNGHKAIQGESSNKNNTSTAPSNLNPIRINHRRSRRKGHSKKVFYQKYGGVKQIHNYTNKGVLANFEGSSDNLYHSQVDLSCLATRCKVVDHESYGKRMFFLINAAFN